MTIPHLPDYIPDHDNPDSADDMYLPGVVAFRMERMDSDCYWIGLTLANGEQVNVDVTSIRRGKRSGVGVRVNAYVRERKR